MQEAAKLGAMIEFVFDRANMAASAKAIREVGVAYCILSSDLGQPFNPPVEDGIALFADKLLEAGFKEDEVRVMAVDNSRLIGL